MREVKFVGKAIMSVEELELNEIVHENGWVTGNLIQGAQPFIVGGIVDGGEDYINHEFFVQVVPDTERPFTGLEDKNGREIYENDITELEVDGDIRRFVVKIKTVVRELVSHPSFVDETAKVAITAVVFEWNGFELFPCVDENGQFDNEKMVIVGNIYEHPHLLEEKQ